MCRTHVIYIFHTSNTGVYPTYAFYVYNYMCNTGIYPTVLHVWKYRYNTCVADTCGIHMFYMCNTPKTPHMYYMCTTGQVWHNNVCNCHTCVEYM